ncbi:sulfatase family protein [Leeuwenhoekiella palythoae]|uniref:Arylsulfatase A n=1 Tax=Leeuwenhoekiella palythoae TaxID=573501 RepID=A0A1M5WJX1_9FLAO|nr:sulfatase [Leeuwenhoekiella palythoae]RXG31383.1 arylsulfatase A-like enzyme [Leeuwenhoekiella palythoae]SHH87413.1 Arylsulfatase A [Leeuwenhoekiella palythoae]
MKKLLSLLLIISALYSCKTETKKTEVAEAKSEKPNIIFIMSDDHAFQAISAYGHPVSQLAPTPNIDRIAQNGMRMNRAYVTNSICGPSRAVILTGKHSHINGFRQNGDRFDGDQPTLPKKLQELGYTTAILGKWHLHGYPQGFDHWKIIQDQGNYYNPNFIEAGDTTQIEGYATDIITEDAITWLDQQRDTTKPFFMMVHHKAPHRNWMPALRYANKYDSINFPLPETYFTDHEGSKASKEQLQTIYKDMYEGHDLKMTKKLGSPELAHNPWTTDFERMTPEQRAAWDKAYQPKNDAFHKADLHSKALAEWKGQRYLRDYMATIAAVDEGVGNILDYLEANNLDENTIVVYTSDQGFYLGEKGFFDKRYMYEESYRTPLLIQYPKAIKAGSHSEALVQNLDFAQTFLDYAEGNNLATDMQGQSLRPVLEQHVEADDFREVLYYHYYDFPAFHMVKKHYGVSTKRYKLMHFYDDIDTWEFYDLESDPQEVQNKIDDPAYANVIKSLHKKLDSVQEVYGLTEKEFERAPAERVAREYKNFERLRGTPMQ